MTLKKNRYYDLQFNGKIYRQKFFGLVRLGYMFKSHNKTNDAIFFGIDALRDCNPVLVKIGK